MLRGTALASTLLLGGMLAPVLASAQATCPVGTFPPPDPILIATNSESIDCRNDELRRSDSPSPLGVTGAIQLITTAGDYNISLVNSGALIVDASDGAAIGILTSTGPLGGYPPGPGSGDISIVNSGDVWVESGDLSPPYDFLAAGIVGLAWGPNSSIHIENNSAVTVAVGQTNGVNTVGVAGTTFEPDSLVDLRNRGDITITIGDATGAPGAPVLVGGMGARSFGDDSRIDVVNDGGNIKLTIGNGNNVTASGILGHSIGSNSNVSIENNGTIEVTKGLGNNSVAFGIYAGAGYTLGYPPVAAHDSRVEIRNSGDMVVTIGPGDYAYAAGIFARGYGDGNSIDILNSGDIRADAAGNAFGISAQTDGYNSPLTILNSGNLSIDAGQNAIGIRSQANGASSTTVTNTGKIAVSGSYNAFGIFSQVANAPISIVNRGDIAAMSDMAYAVGIFASSYTNEVSIANSGNIVAEGSIQAMGLFAQTAGGPVSIVNSGDLTASAGDNAAVGIFGQTYGSGGSVSINNSGDISADSPDRYAGGIVGLTSGDDSSVSITNSGNINAAHSRLIAAGMYGSTRGANSGITIKNSGALSAIGQSNAFGILAKAYGPNSPVSIINSGSIYGKNAGIYATSATTTKIVNTGNISSGLGPAISVSAGAVQIQNFGHLIGFMQLDADDTFINEAGGVFEARRTSDFDASGTGGHDLFRNKQGARVHASGTTSFINLERFENQGLIALADGTTGDSFTISNKPGGTDLDFVASRNSTLTLDTFLGGARSPTDTLTIQGNVSGVTTVRINNTNTTPGVFNPGIKVVTVTGTTPTGNEFQLDQPIDRGFFAYDLFFTPMGSGFWSLKSFPDADAHLLPQLVTAAQDIWHQGSSTWFDRTADLRVLLNGGAAPTAYNPDVKSLSEAPGNVTPAVWARGSGGWLSRDDRASTSAYGRTYGYNLDRELQTIEFQMGLDLGKRDFLSQGDVLVFGVLGGLVQANLDYDHRVRQFDFDGGQVGAYATYLKGGLFVDTLFNAHLYALDDNGTLGLPRSLDASTLGVRTDTGYRFGSFSGGPFIEPLGTLEVTWADIDGFSLGGNAVSFDDDANVRGRLGLRAGTTMAAWEGTLMEPFVTGSLWGNLTDDNSATLVSSGRTFRFEDELDDVWSEVSAGVAFFNFSQTTAVFAKVDVTFGDELSGIGGKAGMRVSW